MTTTATLVYSAYLGGLSGASTAAVMGAVPLPPSLLAMLGVRVLSDATVAGNPTVRTIVLGLNPLTSATAIAVLEDNDSGSPVKAVTVTSPGADYVVPPQVSFTGGRPVIVHAQSTANAAAENMYTPSLNGPAAAAAFLKIVSATVTAPGSGYSAETFIRVVGQLKSSGEPPPGAGPPLHVGRPAILTPTIALGAVTGVAVTDPGSGYTGVPAIEIIDPSSTPGAGAAISVSMGIGSIEVTRGGSGYRRPVPTVVLTPFFQFMFPPTGDQSVPFRNLLNTALEQALMSPVAAAPPVIA